MPRRSAVLSILSVLLLSCGADISSHPTYVDPTPVRIGFIKENALVLSLPVLVEKRADEGLRNILEMRVTIKTTRQRDGALLVPNGFIVGPRYRW